MGEVSRVLAMRAVWARVTPETRTCTTSPLMAMLSSLGPVPMALSKRRSTRIRSTIPSSSSVAA